MYTYTPPVHPPTDPSSFVETHVHLYTDAGSSVKFVHIITQTNNSCALFKFCCRLCRTSLSKYVFLDPQLPTCNNEVTRIHSHREKYPPWNMKCNNEVTRIQSHREKYPPWNLKCKGLAASPLTRRKETQPSNQPPDVYKNYHARFSTRYHSFPPFSSLFTPAFVSTEGVRVRLPRRAGRVSQSALHAS